jgi:transcriptional regulator with XRE-family HTH domain
VADHSSPTLRARRLATELRRLRHGRGLTGEMVAARLGWSESKVSRIELGRTGVKEADVSRLLDLYKVSPARRSELLALAREAVRGSREALSLNLTAELSDYLAAEAEARLLLSWQPQIVPGLLQTGDYARAVIRGVQEILGLPPGDIERRVEARLARQRLFDRDPPLELSVVMDESVLHRRFGTPETMREQLEYLAERSRSPSVRVCVLPLDGDHPIGTGSFMYLQFPQVHMVPLPDTVYVEQLVTNYRIESEDDTYKYRLTFDRLSARALPPAPSRELILRAARQFWA